MQEPSNNTVETAEAAIATARKNLQRGIAKLPHRVKVTEENIVKKVRKHTGTTSEKLELLYNANDEVMAELYPYTPCKKGCSACCHINVAVLPEEIRYITEKTSIQSISPTPARDFHGQPCPFLVDNVCTIYDYRPYTCRRHAVFFKTAQWCATDKCNTITAAQARSDLLNEAFHSIVGRHPSLDIRQVFSAGVT